jgi:hypothetical protein
MKLSNGADSLLCSQNLPVGNISQLKLVLGTNNKVILKDGSVKPLYLLASQLSALKIKIDADLNSDYPYELYLDVDIARSIRVDNAGTYFFFPSIRTYTETTTGGVSGNIKPTTVPSYVGLISGADTLASAISKDGFFYMKGIPSNNNYRLVILPLSDTTYYNNQVQQVKVDVGKVTEYTIDLFKRYN